MAEIVLFGATGFTGTIVAEQMHERGLPFAVAGRNQSKLEQLSARLGNVPICLADVERPYTLNTLTQDTQVLVNCVGPFLHYGEPVVNAAVEHGVHYLDITGEQTWMKRIVNRYDGFALRNDTTVINAMAFDYAVGDWLAALAARKVDGVRAIDSISVGYAVSRGGISQGTALSALEMLGERGWSYEGSHWQRRPLGWTHRRLPFPFGEREVTWLPFGETIMVPRHKTVRTVLTYGRLPSILAHLLPLANYAGSAVRFLLRSIAKRYVARQFTGPSLEQRRHTCFALTAEARRAGRVEHAMATGIDPYGLTARIAALGAELLLTESVPRGVRTPAHLPITPYEALKRVGVRLHE
ncbi:MAG: saccharopine dehydrogenase NADP-binding domain-containing protein [Chloroflexota bacterium]|nr:saccharopine dehydrogenase NADP-binding domain-containing protein [Chloroflexota bacterium]